MHSRKSRIAIISPALQNANNGNWQTARRWRRFLDADYNVTIAGEWTEAASAPDAMIALHARRSAASIARFSDRFPQRPLIVVLTGTDLYRDIRHDASARRSLALASTLVVLQDEGAASVPRQWRNKCTTIFQSAATLQPVAKNRRRFELIVVGHMRDEKDPLTAMRALAILGADAGLRLTHIGAALDPQYESAARELAACNASYRWLGPLPNAETRQRIKRAHALLVTSRMEGGANVVVEAVTSGVSVLASAIPGNIGLLGRDYAGYFKAGDAAALAKLIARAQHDSALLARLRRQCAKRAPLFSPARERKEVIKLARSSLRRSLKRQ
jgi:putative glycosyltransferase (TIGR04348 family)